MILAITYLVMWPITAFMIFLAAGQLTALPILFWVGWAIWIADAFLLATAGRRIRKNPSTVKD